MKKIQRATKIWLSEEFARSRKGLFLWSHSTYSLQINKNIELLLLFHTLAFCCQLLKLLKAPWMIWMIRCYRGKTVFLSTKKTNQQHKYFTNPFVFVMPTSKHKHQCFLILVQSFDQCSTFSRICVLIVSNTNFHQFGLKCSFYMAQTRSQNKTAAKQNYIHSNNLEEAKSIRWRTATSQWNFFVCCHRDFALIG